MNVSLLNQDKKEVKKLTLQKDLFECEKPEFLIHQAVNTELSNRRNAQPFFKNRALVSGGGVKPWRQKGTGRARQGSIRSPQWVGGGAVFGAQRKNVKKNINKKQRRKALAATIALLLKDKKVFILEDLKLKNPKTKEVLSLFKKLGVSSGVVVDSHENKNLVLALQNLQKYTFVTVSALSIFELLKFEGLIISYSAWEKLLERLSAPQKVVKNEKSS
ncbi:MAG: 50S ribosomal protein L4 [Deltaproteobacteria bacterium]|nr:50S ribosomal protein L4 [Deltaproteobacteria bacterium]